MVEQQLRNKRYALLFGIRRSVRYHVKRQQFFDRLHSLTSALSIILGSTAVVALIKDNWDYVGIPAAALVTVLSSIDLVVGYSKKARLHERLSGKFIDLEKKIISVNEAEFSDADLAHCTQDRLNIEAEEPPAKNVLDSICHNEMLRAQGIRDASEYVRITTLQRLLAQFCDYRQNEIVKPGHPRS